MGVLTWIFGLKLPEREPVAPKPELQPLRLVVRNDDPRTQSSARPGTRRFDD
ncbi:hypothetical protein [Microbaculum marinum]|uniref:Uncharacterized protein n=1 Tax=Microbaculum marinum TaxID=1764581 RepID=A0AAW9RPX8_9HYPH